MQVDNRPWSTKALAGVLCGITSRGALKRQLSGEKGRLLKCMVTASGEGRGRAAANVWSYVHCQ